MNYKKFVSIILGIVFIGLVIVASTVIYIDPFFHYHKPRPEFYYTLRNERYQNDGILKHFEYDSIITGTSMTQNFKTSEFDDLFNANAIKVAFAGAKFKEVNDAINVAYKSGKKVKYVVRSLDTYCIVSDKDVARDDLGIYPVYLYNDDIYDDVKYVLNGDAFLKHSLRIIKDKVRGRNGGITSFDEYKNWNKNYKFGRKYVVTEENVYLSNICQKNLKLSEMIVAKENIQENVLNLAHKHPETTFYYFFPPYSVAYWANQSSKGELERSLAAEKLAIEMILECPNIKLFSFNLMTDIVTDLNNYKDTTHYGEWINSAILKYMKNDIGLLTKDNYKDYLEQERQFYLNYPYGSI